MPVHRKPESNCWDWLEILIKNVGKKNHTCITISFFFFTVGEIEYYRFQLQVKAVLLYIIMALSAYELNSKNLNSF